MLVHRTPSPLFLCNIACSWQVCCQSQDGAQASWAIGAQIQPKLYMSEYCKISCNGNYAQGPWGTAGLCSTLQCGELVSLWPLQFSKFGAHQKGVQADQEAKIQKALQLVGDIDDSIVPDPSCIHNIKLQAGR